MTGAVSEHRRTGRRRSRSEPLRIGRALVLLPVLVVMAMAPGHPGATDAAVGDRGRVTGQQTARVPSRTDLPIADDPGARQEDTVAGPATGRETTRPDGEPVRVVVPAIGVDAPLVRLGLDANRHMEVPDFGLAGWYVEGPKPGHPGPSAIAAHVDSRRGPDVFYRLGDLAPGDEVRVLYDSGQQVTFVVRSAPVQTPKDELPGDDIWPVTSKRLLTLITCGGSFDHSTGRYRDNVIVYTEPANVAPATPSSLRHAEL